MTSLERAFKILNVGSNADQTTAARIRDAALRLFAAHGFDRTSVRQIAAEAGVPVGLVNYHFGSKDGLRDAVDDWVIERIGDEKMIVMAGGSLPAMQAFLAEHPEMQPMLDYLVMSLRTGGRTAAHIFDRMLAVTHDVLDTGAEAGFMREYSDRAAIAVLLVSYGIGASLMGDQIARHLGGERLLDPHVYERYGRASVEMFTRPLFTDDRFLDAMSASDGTPVPPAEVVNPEKEQR